MNAPAFVLQVGSAGRHPAFISGAPGGIEPFDQELEPQLCTFFGLFLPAFLTFLGSSLPSIT